MSPAVSTTSVRHMNPGYIPPIEYVGSTLTWEERDRFMEYHRIRLAGQHEDISHDFDIWWSWMS